MDMKSILLRISEATDEVLHEESRAPVYPATGPYGILEILKTGVIRSSPGGFVSASRDKSFRYYWTGEYGDTAQAPFQFVLNTDVLRQRFSVKPFDYASDGGHGFDTGLKPRAEREERIRASEIPVNAETVKEIVLEPVTKEFLDNTRYADDHYLIRNPNYSAADPIKFSGIKPIVYHEIEHLAREKGIPIVDRRK